MNTYIKSTYFLFFFIIQFAYSQEYVPFPEDSTVWRESWVHGADGYQISSGAYQYYLFGKTIINGKEYSQLYEGYNHPFSTDIIYNADESKFIGVIREEDKQIYFAEYILSGDSIDISNEMMLYDFNLNVGDTLECFQNHRVADAPSAANFVTVTAIDSIQMVNGSFRKRYVVYHEYILGEPFIMEGVGGSDGLFYPCGSDNWHAYNSLGCMGTVEDYIYSRSYYEFGTEVPPDATCYNTLVGTEEVTYESLTLQPNPTTGIVRLSEPVYDVHLSVYSAIGQKVRDERSFNGSFIDLNGLASGVYFVVMLGDENYLGKVVKE